MTIAVIGKGVKGFDISHHQDVTEAEMRQAKAAGYDFVIIRASHGMSSKDLKFEQHYAAAMAAGLKIGVYAYYYYADAEKSGMETDCLLKAIVEKEINLPVFIDFENRGEYLNGQHLGMLTKGQITDRALAALAKIKAAGYRFGIYADTDWLNNKMEMSRIPDDCVVWAADWSGPLNYAGRCELRQTSSKGTVPGVGSGNVDIDELLVELQINDTTPEAVPVPGSVPEPEPLHQIGEHIVFSTCYRSSTDKVGLPPAGMAILAEAMARNHGTITRVIKGANNPYLLDNGLCWVNDGDIRGPYTSPQQQAAAKKTYAVGDTVTINGTGFAASDGSGNSVKKTNKSGRIRKIKVGAKYPFGVTSTGGAQVDAWFSVSSIK